ncbi:hypothetical protein EIN_185780 [Entamoeba invadens IP1]|uniref:hypothetical protein n=1 Tax=Entamoeba invadens IP1 TaxID=370355 RepID=UPI0002C3E749|nr:hypothetical protein EIN_185780 [Entamoeba invadens IP1]ELP94171.1 hypothetical protein EIN_185780 [Entamoeba invadens IP1]|eukprot:XP_004260942.1 hypothetical protein EIN_185780 [Entamoeba invadens IP1]
MEDLLRMPTEKNYEEIVDNDQENALKAYILQKKVQKLLLIIAISVTVAIPLFIIFHITTRPHSFTCDSNNRQLFTKYLPPIEVTNTSKIMPMYGVVTFVGNFISKSDFPVDIKVQSINENGEEIHNGYLYNITSISTPSASCTSAKVYMTKFQLCNVLRFTLFTTPDLTHPIQNNLYDRVRFLIRSPESINHDFCDYYIDYILMNNTQLQTNSHVEEKCGIADLSVFFTFTDSVQTILQNKVSLNFTCKSVPTLIGCGVEENVESLYLPSRNITFVSSKYFSSIENQVFTLFFNEIIEVMGEGPVTFYVKQLNKAINIYPYINVFND